MAYTTFVALLRGINVGKAKRVAMADLRRLLEELGFGDVRTLLVSGNAVFTATGTATSLEKKIATAIDAELGLDVKVLVRSANELDAVVKANPFADTKSLHASFLDRTPSAAKVKALKPADYKPDEFAMGKRVIYRLQPNGTMGSNLPDFERVLGVVATTRNWNTVTKLHALLR